MGDETEGDGTSTESARFLGQEFGGMLPQEIYYLTFSHRFIDNLKATLLERKIIILKRVFLYYIL